MPDGRWSKLEHLIEGIYFIKKLKWYEKIWYFIARKKNEFKPLGEIKGISYKEEE